MFVRTRYKCGPRAGGRAPFGPTAPALPAVQPGKGSQRPKTADDWCSFVFGANPNGWVNLTSPLSVRWFGKIRSDYPSQYPLPGHYHICTNIYVAMPQKRLFPENGSRDF